MDNKKLVLSTDYIEKGRLQDLYSHMIHKTKIGAMDPLEQIKSEDFSVGVLCGCMLLLSSNCFPDIITDHGTNTALMALFKKIGEAHPQMCVESQTLEEQTNNHKH